MAEINRMFEEGTVLLIQLESPDLPGGGCIVMGAIRTNSQGAVEIVNGHVQAKMVYAPVKIRDIVNENNRKAGN